MVGAWDVGGFRSLGFRVLGLGFRSLGSSVSSFWGLRFGYGPVEHGALAQPTCRRQRKKRKRSWMRPELGFPTKLLHFGVL